MAMLGEVYAAHPFWIWMALAGVLLAAEVSSGSGWLLWPAGSAAAVGLLTLILPHNPALEVSVFAVLTVATALVGRRFIPKGMGTGPDINDNIGRLVGKQGAAVAPFEHGRGRVFIDGKEWAALAEGDEPGADQPIEVLAAEGSVLRVKAL